MASIDFVAHETVVPATWLNEIDRTQHDILGNPSNAADVRTAISVDSSAEVTAKDDAILADLASTDSGKGSYLIANVPMAVNVKDYGASPSASGSANSTALQAAIDEAIAGSKTLFIPNGVYELSEQLVVTSAIRIIGEGTPGPRVYANPSTAYGGAELVYTKSVTTNTDTGSFAIKLDTGSIGSEGNAQIEIENIGISWTDVNAGGIYIEGASGYILKNLWLNGGLTGADANTLDGIGIYARNAICGRIDTVNFFATAYGIVATDIFNENIITNCNFQKSTKNCINISAVTSSSVRNTISRNNIIGNGTTHMDTAIHIAGDVQQLTINDNTFEITGEHPIKINRTQPITGDTLDDSPIGIDIHNNVFIACGLDINPAFAVQVSYGDFIHVHDNTVKSATELMSALVNISALSSNVFVARNHLDIVPSHWSGNPPTIIDTELYRLMPWDASETSHSGWDGDYQGNVWFNDSVVGSYQKCLRLWNGSRALNLLTGGARTDSTSDTTPEVLGLSTLTVTPSGTYTVTNFDNGVIGQSITVFNSSAHNVTIDCTGTNLFSESGSDIVLTQNKWATFKNLDGTTWVQY